MGSLVSRPMPLLHLPAAFDHPDCPFELKHDGFRAFTDTKLGTMIDFMNTLAALLSPRARVARRGIRKQNSV